MEIISLSIGTASNHVSCHYWNEKSKDQQPSSQLFRSVQSSNKKHETHMPRSIMLELKERFGKFQYLYGETEDDEDDEYYQATWTGKTMTIPQEPFRPSSFSQVMDASIQSNTRIPIGNRLEHTVKFWSDFNQTPFHPRTVVEIPSPPHKENEDPMMHYQQGLDVLGKLSGFRDIMFEERIRYFLEECDNFQGFNLFADTLTGFGSIAAGLIQEISDQMPKSPVHVYGICIDEILETCKLQKRKSLNHARFVATLMDTKAMYIPIYSPLPSHASSLALKGISIGRFSNLYMKSAYAATALDTITSLLTKKEDPVSMAEISSMLGTNRGYNIAVLSCAFPFGEDDFSHFIKRQQIGDKVDWLYNLSFQQPYVTVERHAASFSVLRGCSSIKQNSNTVFSLHQFLSSFQVPYSYERNTWLEEPIHLNRSYPQYFNNLKGINSALSNMNVMSTSTDSLPSMNNTFINTYQHRQQHMRSGTTSSSLDQQLQQSVDGNEESISSFAKLYSSKGITGWLQKLISDMPLKSFTNRGEEDQYEETREMLKTMKQNYDELF